VVCKSPEAMFMLLQARIIVDKIWCDGIMEAY
jgi:hypothetical protein